MQLTNTSGSRMGHLNAQHHHMNSLLQTQSGTNIDTLLKYESVKLSNALIGRIFNVSSLIRIF